MEEKTTIDMDEIIKMLGQKDLEILLLRKRVQQLEEKDRASRPSGDTDLEPMDG